jgi:hypothetical protein
MALIVLLVLDSWLAVRALSERGRIDARITAVQARQDVATRQAADASRLATCGVTALYLQPDAVPATAYGRQLAAAYAALGRRLHCPPPPAPPAP